MQYTGEISNQAFRDKGFGFINFSKDGKEQRIFYSIQYIVPDWRGCRLYAFTPGNVVTFEIGLNKTTGRTCATNVTSVFQEPGNLETHREVSTVSIVGPYRGYFYLRRDEGDGDEIYFHISNVVPGHEDRLIFLQVGTPVYHGIKRDEDGRFRADQVELYDHDEIWNFLNPKPEIEPLPEPEVQSELLKPENKSKTIAQLIAERRAK